MQLLNTWIHIAKKKKLQGYKVYGMALTLSKLKNEEHPLNLGQFSTSVLHQQEISLMKYYIMTRILFQYQNLKGDFLYA